MIDKSFNFRVSTEKELFILDETIDMFRIPENKRLKTKIDSSNPSTGKRRSLLDSTSASKTFGLRV